MDVIGCENDGSFNSTLVQLKVVWEIEIYYVKVCFNSTLVQLKATSPFHTGPFF